MKKIITKMLNFIKTNKEYIDGLTSVVEFFSAILIVVKFFFN